jgi:hypothetical protein
MAGWYFALGPRAGDDMNHFLERYHADMGRSRVAELRAASRCTSPAALRRALSAFADVGTEEVIVSPVSANVDQLDRLADAIG